MNVLPSNPLQNSIPTSHSLSSCTLSLLSLFPNHFRRVEIPVDVLSSHFGGDSVESDFIPSYDDSETVVDEVVGDLVRER